MYDGISATETLSGAHHFPIRLAACALALGIVASTGSALARSAYDGSWSVQILTRSGACEPAIRYGVRIIDGRVQSPGNAPAAVDGHVSPSGSVRVSVQASGASASGTGRLRRDQGGGIWRGHSSNGVCEGTWLAERRGGPVYDYAPGYNGYSQ